MPLGFVKRNNETNEEYLATIPDEYPEKPAIMKGVAELDAQFPGWQITQIKTKFNEIRFYADPPQEGEFDKNEFHRILWAAEAEATTAFQKNREKRREY